MEHLENNQNNINCLHYKKNKNAIIGINNPFYMGASWWFVKLCQRPVHQYLVLTGCSTGTCAKLS